MAQHRMWNDLEPGASRTLSFLHQAPQIATPDSLVGETDLLRRPAHGAFMESSGFGLQPGPLLQHSQPLTGWTPFAGTSPSMAKETSFLNGINASGVVVTNTYAAWNKNNPATYDHDHAYASKWGPNVAGTLGGLLDYYFDPASHWTTTEKAAFKSALALWSAVANIQFHESTSPVGDQLVFHRGSDGKAVTDPGDYIFFPGGGTIGGSLLLGRSTSTISIDTSVPGFGPIGDSFDAYGGYPWETILHEIGHALGLGHGGPYNGEVDYATQQFSAYDTRLWTIMSYIQPDTRTNPKDSSQVAKYYDQYTIHPSWLLTDDGYARNPTTPMMLDIIAIQQLYGASTDGVLGGGKTFGFHTNIAGPIRSFFDFNVNSHPIVTLYSSGSGNTLDLSGFSDGARIDLHAGSFSSCAGMLDNLCIASGTIIDTYVGTGGADRVTANSDADTMRGGPGNDTFSFGATFTAADSVNGGGDSDTLFLDGQYGNLVFAATTLLNVEIIDLDGGHDYKLTPAEATVAAGKTLTVDGSELGSGDILTFIGGGEADGRFDLTGGAANDVLKGGAGDDTINGSSGHNTVTGGLGADRIFNIAGDNTLVYGGIAQSNGAHYDTLSFFNFDDDDLFDLNISVTGIDAAIASGTLNTAAFNAGLAAALGASALHLHHAVLFTPDDGDLAGHTFLIVDGGGRAGYQANKDYVFGLENGLELTSLDTSDFI